MAKNNAFKIKEITKKQKQRAKAGIYKILNKSTPKIASIHNTYI